MVFGEGNEHKVGQSEAEWSIGFHSLCSRRAGPSCSRGCGEASITVRYCAILLDSRTQRRNEIEELKRVGQVLSPIIIMYRLELQSDLLTQVALHHFQCKALGLLLLR